MFLATNQYTIIHAVNAAVLIVLHTRTYIAKNFITFFIVSGRAWVYRRPYMNFCQSTIEKRRIIASNFGHLAKNCQCTARIVDK